MKATLASICTSDLHIKHECTGAYGAPLGGADVVIEVAIHPDDVCFC